MQLSFYYFPQMRYASAESNAKSTPFSNNHQIHIKDVISNPQNPDSKPNKK